MPQTASIMSRPDIPRSLPRRFETCVLSEDSVQSGVSSAILSSRNDFVTTRDGFESSAFSIANSVGVRRTASAQTHAEVERYPTE